MSATHGRMAMLRYVVARAMIHGGLKMMPPGRSRNEITALLWEWGAKVHAEVTTRRQADEALRRSMVESLLPDRRL